MNRPKHCFICRAKMCEDLYYRFSLQIDKGIAMGSGMGGSAASAVAAVVALNGFLSTPISKERLVEFALYGENCFWRASCG